MKDKLYDNADSFAISFDKEWENIYCDDLRLKIDKVFEDLSDFKYFIYFVDLLTTWVMTKNCLKKFQK